MSATDKYLRGIEALREFCEEEAALDVKIFTEEYPIKYVFAPREAEQLTLDGDSDEGEGEMIITCGLKTSINNSLKFSIEAPTLKKLLRLAEKTSILYYHSFCELQKGPQTLEEAAR